MGPSDSILSTTTSVRIANQYPAQVTDAGTPARFLLAERTGVSDHWPVVMSGYHRVLAACYARIAEGSAQLGQ